MKKNYNVKKYLHYYIAIVILICLQVYCSTEIPKYMSNSINIGYMQKGVDKIIFNELSYETYDLLVNNSDNKEIFEKNYEKIENRYKLIKNSEKKKLITETSNSLEKILHTDNKKAKISFIINEYSKLNIDYGKSYIKINSLKMLAIALSGTIFVISSGFLISKLSTTVSKILRRKLFVKVENFSNNNLNKFGISSLITRTTNDITRLQTSINMLLKISLVAPITLVIASTKAYLIAPKLMWVLVILSGILLVAIIIALLLLISKVELSQKLLDKLNNMMREILTGKRVIRVFNKVDYENKKFDDLNKFITRINGFIQFVLAIVSPFATFILNISAVFIIYFTAIIIPNNNIGIGSILAFIQYAIQIMVSFLMMTSIFFIIPNAIISFKRIDEVLNEKIDIYNNNNLEKINSIESIEFNNVSFKYNNSESNVVNNINFKINKNETLAIIGSTGSGKTTIIKLLLRLIDATTGSILINGKEINQYELKQLRDKISYTPQIAKLFSGTILENIAYNDNNPDIDRVNEAINLACAQEFADIYKVLNQSGVNLSGGQKQRIQIARSIYKNPSVIIFDDSFSALDNKTDKKIRENLEKLNMIKIFISQKISTIKNADNIIVLNDGDVVGIGKHDELLKNCNIYSEIYNTQTGGAINE